MTDLGTLGGSVGYGTGINNSGQVVGYSQLAGDGPSWHAFVDTGGVMTNLDTLESGLLTNGTSAGFLALYSANAINDIGQITGYGTYFDGTRTQTHAFLLDTETTGGGPTSGVPDTTSTLGLLGLVMGGLILLRRQVLKKGFRDRSPDFSFSP